MTDPRGVTLKRAGELIGGDRPLAVRTISAMIRRGDLEAYGARGGRRVTMRPYVDAVERALAGEVERMRRTA